MIHARKNRIFSKLFGFYLDRLLRKHFYRILLSGSEKLKALNAGYPSILYANHSNWWDGFTAYFITTKLLKRDDYLMMDIEQLKKYSMFRRLGVFSVDKNNPAEVMKSINYASSLLKDSGRFLWIFPQGKMEVQDYRPVEFFGGISKIAEKTGKVNLIPAAFRYEFIMEQRPEIFIKLGTPEIINSPAMINENFTVNLRDKLLNEMDTLKEMVVNKSIGKFEIVFEGKSSRNKTIDRIIKE
jgi:chlorobactene lauroyltransferase